MVFRFSLKGVAIDSEFLSVSSFYRRCCFLFISSFYHISINPSTGHSFIHSNNQGITPPLHQPESNRVACHLLSICHFSTCHASSCPFLCLRRKGGGGEDGVLYTSSAYSMWWKSIEPLNRWGPRSDECLRWMHGGFISLPLESHENIHQSQWQRCGRLP